jgi:histidinol dehydrogenase
MLAIPAKIAGCMEIILCTPPGPDGKIHPAILAAAKLCGVERIYKVGGAQAIAAMAFGTETIPKVSKIFGPGNQYVTTAKMLVYGAAAIDMPAGPSEVMVVADQTARPDWVAADLLSQLEHGPDSQAVLVTIDATLAKRVQTSMRQQTKQLSHRETIMQSLEKSWIVLVKNMPEAITLVNFYAPEHLEVVVKNPETFAQKIINAGSIFLGPYASEPLGDYATGTNHTLPTSAYAKMFGPLSVESFGKKVQFQTVTRQGITNLSKTVETLATTEGLDAHCNAVLIRLKK